MSNTDYEYIKAVLEYGSITEASKKLFISQSALSQYIKRIETKTGIKIFDRDLSPLRLTEAGEIYFSSLEEIKSIEEETLKRIEDLNNMKRGEVIIGATDYLTYYFLSKVLREFNHKYPGISIKLLEGKTSGLNQSAQAGECDFAISYDISNIDELTNINLYQEEVYIALPLDHPIVEKYKIPKNQEGDFPVIDAKLLKNNKIIRMKKGQNLRLIFSELDKYTANSLETILETDSMYLAIKFVSEGLGISIIPRSMALDNNLDCVFVKTNPPLSKRTIMIHYNSTRRLNKPAKILISMLKDFAEKNF